MRMKKWVLVFLLLVVSYTTSGCASLFKETKADTYEPFDDIAGSYAHSQIVELHAKGIVSGEGERTYAPRKPVTREAFMALLGRALGLQPIKASIPAFTDVKSSSWSYGWIQAGIARNLVSGVTRDTFAPVRPVTRQEAATLMYRALRTTQTSQQAAAISLSFADEQRIATWARPAVKELYERNLLVGDKGYFRPLDPVTREEMAVLLSRLLEQPDLQRPANNRAAFLHMGWQYGSGTQEFIKQVQRSNMVGILSPRWYFLDSSEKITDSTDTSLLAWARENKKEVWPLVGNRFDRELTHLYLSNPTKRSVLVNQLTTYAEQYGLAGLNIDFENIDPSDRDNFTLFIAELSQKLHASQKKLSVDVPPDLKTDWSDPYDFAALARHADYVVMMAYEETWQGSGKAGSNASLPWVKAHVERMLGMVPEEKLMVGLPFYTSHWEILSGDVRAVSLGMKDSLREVQASGIRPVWDAKLGQYRVTYRKNGRTYAVWLEESRSLSLKYEMVRKLGVAGVTFWYMGAESEEVWPAFYNVPSP
jgi:spore germination protein